MGIKKRVFIRLALIALALVFFINFFMLDSNINGYTSIIKNDYFMLADRFFIISLVILLLVHILYALNPHHLSGRQLLQFIAISIMFAPVALAATFPTTSPSYQIRSGAFATGNDTLSDSYSLNLSSGEAINFNASTSLYAGYFGFIYSLDVSPSTPSIIFVNQTDELGAIINISQPLITEQNITLRVNVTETGYGIDDVWIIVWETIEGANKFFEDFLGLVDIFYEISIPINLTYPLYDKGELNYTIYANDTLNMIVNISGQFYISYNTTALDVGINISSVEREDLFTLFAYYNLSNGTIITDAECNATIEGVTSAFTYDTTNQKHENATVNASIYSIGNNSIYWECGKSAHESRSDNTTFTIYDYAEINISSPRNDAIFYPTNISEFFIDKIRNEWWVSGVNLTIAGPTINVTYAAINTTEDTVFTNYTFNYTIPNINSTYLNITAHGLHNSTKEVNATIRIRTSVPGAAMPDIRMLCASPTYSGPNATVNITVHAKLGLLVESINLTVEDPDGMVDSLSAIWNNSDDYESYDYFFIFNYSFEPNKTGNYNISAEIADLNDQRAVSEVTAYVRNNQTVNFTGVNTDTIRLKDVCSGETLYSGQSISEVITPGQYNTEVVADKETIMLANSTMDNTVTTVCNYTDIDENVTLPTRDGYTPRAIDQWETECFPKFDSVNLTYDYSTKLSTIVNENFLELYKCQSQDNCTWSLLTETRDTEANTVFANFSNFSVLMLSEDLLAGTIILSVSGGEGGGGGGGAGATEVMVSMEIVSPAPISLYTGDRIIVPILVRNTGNVVLNDITLAVRSSSPEIGAELSILHIDRLMVREEVRLDMIVTAAEEVRPIIHTITITADVVDPLFRDSAQFFVNMLDVGLRFEDMVWQKILFLMDMLDKNPECLELAEYLERAKIAFEDGKFQEALDIAESTIRACEDMVGKPLVERLEMPKKMRYTILILLLEVVLFIAMFSALYRYYRRRRQR